MPDPGPLASRRRFLSRLVVGLHGALGLLLSVPFLGYLLAAPRRGREAEWVPLGPPPDLPLDQPTRISFEVDEGEGWWRRRARQVAWLVRRKGGEWVAFAPRCTHLGCPYFWNSERERFLCPCHGGAFDLDGRVLDGPPPRPLDRHRVRIEGNDLLIEAAIRPAGRPDRA